MFLLPSSCLLRGCSELYRIPMVEYKVDSEGTPCEYKTPFRRNTTWHRVPSAGGAALSRGSPTQGPDRLQCQQILQQHQAAIPRSTSFDRKLPDGSRWAHILVSTPLVFASLFLLPSVVHVKTHKIIHYICVNLMLSTENVVFTNSCVVSSHNTKQNQHNLRKWRQISFIMSLY